MTEEQAAAPTPAGQQDRILRTSAFLPLVGASCRRQADAMTTEPTSAAARQIGISLFDGVEELDAVGPWEVLAHWTQQYPQDGWAVSCLSRDGRPVTAAKGLVPTP